MREKVMYSSYLVIEPPVINVYVCAMHHIQTPLNINIAETFIFTLSVSRIYLFPLSVHLASLLPCERSHTRNVKWWVANKFEWKLNDIQFTWNHNNNLMLMMMVVVASVPSPSPVNWQSCSSHTRALMHSPTCFFIFSCLHCNSHVFIWAQNFIRLFKRSKSFIRTGIQHMCESVLRFAFAHIVWMRCKLLFGMFLWFKQESFIPLAS